MDPQPPPCAPPHLGDARLYKCDVCSHTDELHKLIFSYRWELLRCTRCSRRQFLLEDREVALELGGRSDDPAYNEGSEDLRVTKHSVWGEFWGVFCSLSFC
jgi:hypothetical protein